VGAVPGFHFQENQCLYQEVEAEALVRTPFLRTSYQLHQNLPDTRLVHSTALCETNTPWNTVCQFNNFMEIRLLKAKEVFGLYFAVYFWTEDLHSLVLWLNPRNINMILLFLRVLVHFFRTEIHRFIHVNSGLGSVTIKSSVRRRVRRRIVRWRWLLSLIGIIVWIVWTESWNIGNRGDGGTWPGLICRASPRNVRSSLGRSLNSLSQ